MMKYADHHGLPIITFIDTPGAFADLNFVVYPDFVMGSDKYTNSSSNQDLMDLVDPLLSFQVYGFLWGYKGLEVKVLISGFKVWGGVTGSKQYTFKGHKAPVFSVCPQYKENIQ
ncbi:hypothetical protein MKX01_038848, partial [Papaver californicum]